MDDTLGFIHHGVADSLIGIDTLEYWEMLTIGVDQWFFTDENILYFTKSK